MLITLGIIGVVAAMMLPALIQNKHHRELETALKKNYSNIQNAVNLMNYDFGRPVGKGTLSVGEFKNGFIKYFKYAKDCGLVGCVGHEGEQDEDGTKYLSKKYRNYNNTNYINSIFLDDGQFMLQDGAMMYLETGSLPFIMISVDVNGYKKGPNRWGHDLFGFQLSDNGKLLPMGAEDTFYSKNAFCNNSSTDSSNGMTCTIDALTDKDYWKNLPK